MDDITSASLAVFYKEKPHVLENIKILYINSEEYNYKYLVENYSKYITNNYIIVKESNDGEKVHRIIYKITNSGNKIEIIDRIPFANEKIESNGIGALLKKDLVTGTQETLFKTIEDIHNYVYANDGLSSNEVFNELMKIFILKYIDEQKNDDEELEFVVKGSDIKTSQDNINNIFRKAKIEYPQMVSENDELHLSDKSLIYAIQELQYFNLFDMDNDVKGVLFQKIITNSQKGERGQFFTPDPIMDFMVRFLGISPKDNFIDPSCGTGGFFRYIIKAIRENDDFEKPDKFIENNVFGTEINPGIAKLANLRFLFESIDSQNVLSLNALQSFNDYTDSQKKIINKEKYSLILTNPPFGTKGRIDDVDILNSFELGKNKRTQVPEILFIERTISLLKPGGRLGIILPDGNLENTSSSFVRKYILEKCNLLAVIKLPNEAFIPFGTGVRSSILFLEKKSEETLDREKIFFGKIEQLGYEYNKNFKTIYKVDNEGNPIVKDNQFVVNEDYSDILSKWEMYLNGESFTEDNKCFLLPKEELNDRFDLEYYKPEYFNNLKAIKKMNSVPLKSVVDIVSQKADFLKEKDKKVNYIQIADVDSETSEIINSTEQYYVHELPSRASYEVVKGDIITSVSGNAIGTSNHASALVNEDYKDTICTNGFKVLRPFAIDPYYLVYFLKTDYFLKQIANKATGAAIPNINQKDLEEILIPILDEKEMIKISNKIKKSYELRKQAKELMKKKYY